jgi:predicted nucleic acid-binding protein
MKVYVDSCIVIYLTDPGSPLHDQTSRAMIDLALQGDILLSSELVRLECRTHPLKHGEMELLAELDRFFSRSIHAWCPFVRPVFNLATELRARHGLKTPDSLHLAAALHMNCDAFWTNDRRLQRAAGEQMRLMTTASLED